MYTKEQIKRILIHCNIEFEIIEKKLFVNDSNVTYYSKQEIRELIYN